MEKHFIIIKDTTKKVARFGVEGHTIEFKIRPIPDNVEPVTWVKGALEQVYLKVTEGVEPGDRIGFTFCSDNLANDGWVKFKSASEVTFDDVWDLVSSIYQSRSVGLDTSTFCLKATIVTLPVGRGRARKFNNFEEECKSRKGIVSVTNDDSLCLARALVLGIGYVDEVEDFDKLRKNTGKIQDVKTRELLVNSGVSIPEEGGGVPELQLFQEHLYEYKITVYQYGTKGRDVLFEGDNNGKKINLLYHNNHYNLITSLTSAFCCKRYCEKCRVPYEHKDEHRCGQSCAGCREFPKCPVNIKIVCDICKRWFRGSECYNKHIKNGICEKIVRCEKCLKTVLADRKHVCGEVYCKICRTFVQEGHLCFMPVDKCSPKTVKTLFIFYDLETRQEKLTADGTLLHEVNLCVFQQCCSICINTDVRVCWKSCGVRQQVLRVNPLDRFVEYVLNQRKLFRKVVVIAHYGGGFDHQLTLNNILTRTNFTPELIMRGTKLISMTIENVKFLDSLNYLAMALSKLPEALGLKELKKGYFPHLFNRLDNLCYVGDIPDISFYEPDNLKPEERDKLVKWHAEKVSMGYVFDFQKELVDYCVSDVNILYQACLKFRELMLQVGNVCPYTESLTLPSACNKIFRRNFLKPGSIGVIPKSGYRWHDHQSKIAVQWMLWEEKQRSIKIQHAGTGPEVTIAGVKVDGYCSDTEQIFEFHGCFFHGCQCQRCNRNIPLHGINGDTLDNRYESTLNKTRRLRSLGYEVIEMWECKFRKMLDNDKITKEYLDNHPVLVNLPLNPRDAFYGGRTGNTKTYHKCQEDEQIKYMDVCSLYPWVNKYGKYPVGHPEVVVGKECKNVKIDEISGLIKCKVLAPKNLFHPLLPMKMNDKLMFVLCNACGETMNTEECEHDIEKRALVGTWVIEEVKKAIEKGYEVLYIYEVWKYETTQYDPVTKDGGLFAEYISHFLKIKVEASGWPVECDTSEKKDAYIRDYYEKEGVELIPDNISFNPGRRQLGKNVITSFWGKLGQKENQSKTSIVNQPSEFFKMFCDPLININSVLQVNGNTFTVNWEFKEEVYDPTPTVNVVLAAYTTATARLKLYSYLERLDSRVLYYDTDSVIYTYRPGQWDIPTGVFLGEMTDELESYGAGSYISEFVSGGPKNYAYKVWSTDKQAHVQVCKVKGISLTYAAGKLVNFDVLKRMVTDGDEPVKIQSKQFRRTEIHEVVTAETSKYYKINSTKRRFNDDGSSYPYGYKKPRLALDSL